MSNDTITAACGASSACGTVSGALSGFGIGIWLLVDYIQPALAASDGISDTGASWITAAIAVCGFLEATTGAGAVAGACAGPVVATSLACAGAGVTAAGAGLYSAGKSCFSLFSSSDNNNNPSDASKQPHDPETNDVDSIATEAAIPA